MFPDLDECSNLLGVLMYCPRAKSSPYKSVPSWLDFQVHHYHLTVRDYLSTHAITKANYERAPSYFSHYFREQLHSNQGRASDVKTLYIDRDPVTFRDIVAHLQGYYVTPRDGEHFVRLFADAQFYSRMFARYYRNSFSH